MEHISDILKKQIRTSTSRENTDTWSEDDPGSPGSPDCDICKGAGIIHPRLPNGKPDYSRVARCPCTRMEPAGERRSRLVQYSNLGSLTRLTFENLEPLGKSGNPVDQTKFQAVFQAAQEYAAEPKGWLVLGGPSGGGKTHLAAAIANERISRGHLTYYISVPDLLDRLRTSFIPDSEVPYDEFFEQVRNTPLLVLDDLGAQSATAWAKEKLDQLLTARFNSELPTVVVVITPLEQMDERLKTRLTDSRLCRVFILEDGHQASEYGWGPEFKLQQGMTFINFKRRTELSLEQQDNMDQAYRVAFDFAKSPEGWLVFMGVTGCGKTHLAAAIVNYRYEAGKPALFIVVPEFFDHLRSTFSPDSKVSYDDVFESVKTAPLLVLDDFGEHSATPWVSEKLYQLINYRYNGRLPTVITTRFSLDELVEQFDSAISSRLTDRNISVAFNIIVPDYRTVRKPSQKRSSPRGKTGRYR